MRCKPFGFLGVSIGEFASRLRDSGASRGNSDFPAASYLFGSE